MDTRPFQNIVREKCGLIFQAEKAAVLADSILARMSQRGMTTEIEYLGCLTRDDVEFSSLVNLLTINETYFFREPVHLDLLTDRLLQEMLAYRTAVDPVRILCAGCSTGEEPYSLMMKFLEKYGAGIRELVAIFGIDIDSEALGKATRGVYGGLSFREFPEELRQRYFEQLGPDRYRIRDFVREKVRFMNLNLLSATYPGELRELDAIFYRNVSIYFDQPTQMNIFRKLSSLLKEGGWLFVSSTETLSHNHGGLALIEIEGVFCFQKKSEQNREEQRRQERKTPANIATAAKTPAAGRSADFSPGRHDPSHRAPVRSLLSKKAPAPTEVGQVTFAGALELARNKNYQEALRCIDVLMKRDPSFVKGYMLKAGILINLKSFGDAEEACRQGIEFDRWNLEGHLLLGVIAKQRSDHETAVKRLKEAIYIQSSCWLGHFYLAEIHSSRGDNKNAVREYEIVIKLLEKGELMTDHGLTFFPLAFSAPQVKHLCYHNLTKLKKATK